MFSKACAIARKYTFPIIISHRTYEGKCQASIGALVVINEDGWFVTAFHVMQQVFRLEQAGIRFNELMTKKSAPESAGKESRDTYSKPDPGMVTNYSIFPGIQGATVKATLHALPEIDLAVGQLDGFDASTISDYPRFKDPAKPMEQGTSLCKGGFPFHSITPVFENGLFNLPPGSLPIPFFPIDGIYTRTVEIKTRTEIKTPLKFIETSTPGLRGQSGGPTFDVHGTIWAIQSRTQHLNLGFGATGEDPKQRELFPHQYLNVGWGVHAATIVSFLSEKNIRFQLSSY